MTRPHSWFTAAGSVNLATAIKEKPFRVELSVEELFGCCGVKVIYNLEKYHAATVITNKALFVSWLREQTNDESDGGWDGDDDGVEFEYVNPEGIALVSLNENMLKHWEPILLEVGFERKTEATNTKSGNRIYIFTKVIHP